MGSTVATDDATVVEEAVAIVRRVGSGSSLSIDRIEPIAVDSRPDGSGGALLLVSLDPDGQFVAEYDRSMVGADTLFQVNIQQVFREYERAVADDA